MHSVWARLQLHPHGRAGFDLDRSQGERPSGYARNLPLGSRPSSWFDLPRTSARRAGRSRGARVHPSWASRSGADLDSLLLQLEDRPEPVGRPVEQDPRVCRVYLRRTRYFVHFQLVGDRMNRDKSSAATSSCHARVIFTRGRHVRQRDVSGSSSRREFFCSEHCPCPPPIRDASVQTKHVRLLKTVPQCRFRQLARSLRHNR